MIREHQRDILIDRLEGGAGAYSCQPSHRQASLEATPLTFGREPAGSCQAGSRGGVALLVVLFIVMVITVTSIGFLSKSDAELACGRNMELWTEVGYTGESAMEEARGFIISPQEIGTEYWSGGVGRQIVDGDDYYDVSILRDDSDATDRCTYTIECSSYRLKGGERQAQSNMTAILRLDPVITYWVGEGTVISRRTTINGDMYCMGDVVSGAIINGDVFSGGSISGSYIEGQSNAYVVTAPVIWPGIAIADYRPNYYIEGSSYSSENIGDLLHAAGSFNASGSNPGGIRYRTGDVELSGGITINGSLIVNGDLIIRGSNVISSVKNFPAVIVDGDLIIEAGGELAVNGLVVVEGGVEISSDGGDLDITGGLFTGSGIWEIVADSSGNSNAGVMAGDIAWQSGGGYSAGALEFDGVDDEVVDAQAGVYLNGLGAITVSIWVKSDVTFQDRGIIFSREPDDADSDLGIRYDQIGVFGGGARGIKASIRATSGYTQIESTQNVQTTDWQHLALVWESGSSLKLYINGVLNSLAYDRGSVSGGITGVTKLSVGVGAKNQFWDGMLDDLRIYNWALDANDIYPPVDGLGGLLTHWRLDESGCEVDITAAPCKTAIMKWSAGGVGEKWEQAGGAIYRSIRRTE